MSMILPLLLVSISVYSARWGIILPLAALSMIAVQEYVGHSTVKYSTVGHSTGVTTMMMWCAALQYRLFIHNLLQCS